MYDKFLKICESLNLVDRCKPVFSGSYNQSILHNLYDIVYQENKSIYR